MKNPLFNSTSDLLNDMLGLLYPRICAACDNTLVKGEEAVCVSCLMQMPVTGFHTERDNWVEKLFWGRVAIEMGMAHCYFRAHTRVQYVLHSIKYHHRPDVGVYMGRWMGTSLKDSVFNTCDIIVPVPLHPDRYRQRGFNQSDSIAEGISMAMNIPWSKNLVHRNVYNISQTKKSRYERWGNVNTIFEAPEASLLKGKHILLVDDVITTGATMEACTHALQSIPGVRVSIAAMACAMQ